MIRYTNTKMKRNYRSAVICYTNINMNWQYRSDMIGYTSNKWIDNIVATWYYNSNNMDWQYRSDTICYTIIIIQIDNIVALWIHHGMQRMSHGGKNSSSFYMPFSKHTQWAISNRLSLLLHIAVCHPPTYSSGNIILHEHSIAQHIALHCPTRKCMQHV